MKLLCWRATSLIVGAFLLGSNCSAADSSGPSDVASTAISLEALSRLKSIDLDANPSLKAVVLKLLEQMRGKPEYVEIVRDFKIPGQTAGLLEVALKNPNSQTGVEAMRLVLKENDLSPLKAALTGTNAFELTQALSNTGEKAIVPLLQPLVLDGSRDALLRREVVRALARVREGAAILLDLAKSQKLSDDLTLTASTELNSVRWDDLRAQAAQILPMPQGKDDHPLPSIPELVKMSGKASSGAEVFRRETVGCSKCHQVNGAGVDFGPNLSEIGTKLAKEAIYESILDPSAGIAFGYEAWSLELKNDNEAYGLIVSETADELAMKTIGGVVIRYKKVDIAKRTKQKLSIMPTGLAKTMSVQELVDLVEYLSSLKKATVH